MVNLYKYYYIKDKVTSLEIVDVHALLAFCTFSQIHNISLIKDLPSVDKLTK